MAARHLLLYMMVGVMSAMVTHLMLDSLTLHRCYSHRLMSLRPNSLQMADSPASAQQLQQKVRTLVWVLTCPQNHKTKAAAVRDTWAKRVDKILFMSSEDDPDLPTIKLNVTEGRNSLWAKSRAAFQYVYDHHLNDTDWFMKLDDDTFLVVENLRYMLSLYDPANPIFFGHRFKKYAKQGYMSGGGGYVLSRAALKLLVEKGLPDPSLCSNKDTWAEDVEMGKCLDRVGVMAGDSRDHRGRRRFFIFEPTFHLIDGMMKKDSWYFDFIYYPAKLGSQCCSDTAITFHYISPNKMREMYYLVYHLRPYGVSKRIPYPPQLPPDLDSVPKETAKKYNKTT